MLLIKGLFTWVKEEEKAFVRLASGLANPRKDKTVDILGRLFLLFYIVGYNGVRALWMGLFLLSFVCLLPSLDSYLGACDPLPPCRGKIQDWLMRLFGQTSRAQASN